MDQGGASVDLVHGALHIWIKIQRPVLADLGRAVGQGRRGRRCAAAGGRRTSPACSWLTEDGKVLPEEAAGTAGKGRGGAARLVRVTAARVLRGEVDSG